ncbi:hypothetical protein C8J57DRAFT_1217129 [Mycena rebaudengoi]|nr:hypothetical protein C8J57DRAFT_1217129 [Mycena rebaudengoi]
MSDTQPNFVPPSDSPSVLVPPTPQTYEPILFLDRTATSHPRCHDSDIGNCTPIQVIDTSVHREWHNYLWQEPIHLRPGFSATAQLSYHGVEVDERGQRIHHLSSLNAIQIITEPENGRSSTLLGHAYTYFLECPDPGHKWRGREAPYPSPERITSAMASLTHSDEPALAFPCCGTASPPLLPREVRELPEELTSIPPTRFPKPERGVHPLNDSRWSEPLPPYAEHESAPATSPPSSDTVETSPATSSDDDESSVEFAELDARPVFEEEDLRRLDEEMDAEADEDEEEEVVHVVDGLTEEEERFFRWLGAQRRGNYLRDNSLPPHDSQHDDVPSSSNNSMPSLVTMDNSGDELKSESYRECPAWRAPSPTPTHPDSRYKAPPVHLVEDRARVRPDTPIPPCILLDSGKEIMMDEFTAHRSGSLDNIPAVPQSHWTHNELQKWVESANRSSRHENARDWEELHTDICKRLVLAAGEEHESSEEVTVQRAIQETDTSNEVETVNNSCGGTEYIVDELMMYAEEILKEETETPASDEEAEKDSTSKAVQSQSRGCDDVEPYGQSSFHDVFTDPLLVSPHRKSPAPEKEPLFLPDSDSDSSSSGFLPPQDFLNTCENTTGRVARPCSMDPDAIYESTLWCKHCTMEQQANKEWEMSWAAEPFKDARDIIFGELRCYLDPIAMATQDIPTLFDSGTCFSLPLMAPISGLFFPSEHVLTPADRSPPTEPQVASPISRAPASVNDSPRTDDVGGRIVMAGASKRKAHKRDSLLSPSPCHAKKFQSIKAVYLANSQIIAQYAEVRHAILKGVEHAEEVISRHNDIDLEAVWVSYHHRRLEPNPIIPFLSPQNLPSEWERIHHPLLYDAEVEKLQMLQIAFRHQGRQVLAELIEEILAVRFHHGYALGQLLIHGYLDHHDEAADYLEPTDEMWEDTSDDSFATLPPELSTEDREALDNAESHYQQLEEEHSQCADAPPVRSSPLFTNYDPITHLSGSFGGKLLAQPRNLHVSIFTTQSYALP